MDGKAISYVGIDSYTYTVWAIPDVFYGTHVFFGLPEVLASFKNSVRASEVVRLDSGVSQGSMYPTSQVLMGLG